MRQLVERLDPELEIRHIMGPSTMKVYKVSKRGTDYVLKFGSVAHPLCKRSYENEVTALRENEDLQCITHLVRDYGVVDGQCALLKEFVEGQTLFQSGTRLTQRHLQKQVLETVSALHKRGFADLDLHTNNLVVSPDREYACIIDLGNSEKVTERFSITRRGQLHRLKRQDLVDLETFILPDKTLVSYCSGLYVPQLI